MTTLNPFEQKTKSTKKEKQTPGYQREPKGIKRGKKKLSHLTVFFASATAVVNGVIVAATASHPSRLPTAAQKASYLPLAARMPSAGDVGCSQDSARDWSVFEADDAVRGEPGFSKCSFCERREHGMHACGAGATLKCKHSGSRLFL